MADTLTALPRTISSRDKGRGFSIESLIGCQQDAAPPLKRPALDREALGALGALGQPGARGHHLPAVTRSLDSAFSPMSVSAWAR